MPISARNNQAGVTLLELLFGLTILSLGVGISGVWLAGTLPSLAVRSATSVLETDLKQARLRARLSGQPVTLNKTDTGYTIPSLDINRTWQRGVKADWQFAAVLTFRADTVSSGGTIRLKKGNVYGTVTIDPYTTQISKG